MPQMLCKPVLRTFLVWACCAVEAASNQVASNLWVIRDKDKVDVIHGNSPKRYLAYLAFC